MIALIDYNMGNLFSVAKAFEYCGEKVEVIDRPSELEKFSAAILPGVGNFGDGMEHLDSSGFSDKVRKFASSGRPLLGICLGMQMLLDSSEEAPGAAGLGLIRGAARRFPASVGKVPQIGWNSVEFTGNPSPLLSGVRNGSFFYFVHSFYALPEDPADALGVTCYGIEYASIIGRGRVAGAQFHPEKSQNAGLAIVRNFIKLANEEK